VSAPKKRQEPAHDPCQINELGRPDRLHHFGWYEKDSTADDGSDDYRRSVTHSEVAGKFRGGLRRTLLPVNDCGHNEAGVYVRGETFLADLNGGSLRYDEGLSSPREKVMLVVHPTANVTALPIITHHGHAI
jgi:hypothetical protein